MQACSVVPGSLRWCVACAALPGIEALTIQRSATSCTLALTLAPLASSSNVQLLLLQAASLLDAASKIKDTLYIPGNVCVAADGSVDASCAGNGSDTSFFEYIPCSPPFDATGRERVCGGPRGGGGGAGGVNVVCLIAARLMQGPR